MGPIVGRAFHRRRSTALHLRLRSRTAAALVAALALSLGIGPGAIVASSPANAGTLAVNAPPVAVDDPGAACQSPLDFGGAFPIPEDWGQFAFTGSPCGLTANDSDPDGSIVSWNIVTPPAHGQIEWLPGDPGTVGYTPDPDFSTKAGDQQGGTWRSDSLSYVVIDDQGAESNVATFWMWIAPVNDAPTFTPGPAEVDGSQDTPYSAPWATGIAAGPLNESDQHVHFERTALDLHGLTELFSDPPTLSDDGVLSFTPAPGAIGLSTVTFVAKDDGGLDNYDLPNIHAADTSAPVSFDIIISPAAARTVAMDDTKVVAEDSSATAIEVLANDSDAAGDGLTITAKTDGAKGTVAITAGGSGLTYLPTSNVFGADSFTYTISDGDGATASGTVHVTVIPVNDNPTARDDGVPTPIRIWLGVGARSIAVLANDTWLPDAPETLRILSVSQGRHGSVGITGGGSGLTYRAAGSTLGLDQFSYRISDGHGGTDTASVHVSVAKDTVRPKSAITSLSRAALTDGRVGSRITVRWSLTDAQSGIASQLLQRRIDGGAWVTIHVSSSAARSWSTAATHGHTFVFRVRATDRAGNVGWFATSSSIRS